MYFVHIMFSWMKISLLAIFLDVTSIYILDKNHACPFLTEESRSLQCGPMSLLDQFRLFLKTPKASLTLNFTILPLANMFNRFLLRSWSIAFTSPFGQCCICMWWCYQRCTRLYPFNRYPVHIFFCWWEKGVFLIPA